MNNTLTEEREEEYSVVYEVTYCSECQKPIKSVPSWLAGVSVKFTCDSCRQKHPRPFAHLDSEVVPGVLDDEAEPAESPDGEETTSLDDLLEEEMADEEAAMEKAPED